MQDEANPPVPPVPRNNDPSHPAPIPMSRPVRQPKMHRHGHKTRAPFMGKDHETTKHRLRPKG